VHTHPPPDRGRADRAPPLLAVLFQRSGESYARDHRLPSRQAKVLHAVRTCRTAEAGAHLHVCDTCGYSEQSYNSCRDRHCPNCQWSRQRDWIDARMAAMLPVGHFHVVFTLTSELRALAAFNPEVVYDRMLRAAAETILAITETRLGIRPGITVVLHTWTREMLTHPHVHCIVSAGGENLETSRWKAAPKFLAHVEPMADLFRGKLLCMLKATHKIAPLTIPDEVTLRDLLAPLYQRRWVVFVKAPLDNRQKLVRYLGAYTHRVAISNSRIVRIDEATVTFRTKRRKTITISHHAFIERFLAHVLPKGFRKIRHYGLYAPGSVARLQAVGNDYAEQLGDLPDLPTGATAPITLRTCPHCKQGTLRFALFVPTMPACNDTS
jgi:hypothetical protein